jgi:hypothetical protein
VKHKPNQASNRDRNQDNDEDTPGLQSPMGCFQANQTAENKQDRSREEQENIHPARVYEKLK